MRLDPKELTNPVAFGCNHLPLAARFVARRNNSFFGRTIEASLPLLWYYFEQSITFLGRFCTCFDDHLSRKSIEGLPENKARQYVALDEREVSMCLSYRHPCLLMMTFRRYVRTFNL